jgi:DNA-binding IclR family transcriptional regulator
MSTQQKILKYCIEPKTSAQIAEYCGMEKSGIYTQLGNLQRLGRIEKRGDGRRRVSPAMFVTVRQAPTATESTDDYENLVLTHAHAPFGLRL